MCEEGSIYGGGRNTVLAKCGKQVVIPAYTQLLKG
jgi:hypothetical protein